MNFKRFLLGAAFSVTLGVAIAAPGDPVALLPSAPGTLSASFTQFVPEGVDTDTFTFAPEYFSGLVSVSLTSLTGPVTFLVAGINDQLFGVPADADPYDFSFQAQVTGDTPLTLTVFRVVEDSLGNFGTGSYGVAVTAAVPEPQTWALLFGGLFVVGMAIRARDSRRHLSRIR